MSPDVPMTIDHSGLIPRFPVCIGGQHTSHAAANMGVVEVHRAADKPQFETWRCPECGTTFNCQVDMPRDIPERLRGA